MFFMRRVISITILLYLCVSSVAQNVGKTAFDKWHSDKFSMFVHFGLYSYYGGVWDGKPVTRGYSEQIQSHAGIYGDWYAEAAARFDPVSFDADEIVSLAKKAGMRSVVFTSKHHDGFCMFDTETTGYSSVRMTPSGRDYVKEISDACRKAGLGFGLYFSLIDWNYPYAYPISSHNADFITPEHHRLNMDQVNELLVKYGKISELWFDMGSLTPEQSRELYDLVKSLQPDCLVSGRLGNDMYDFAVMPDNTYPDGSLQAPWQTAASMFDETWSWRSWQERGEVDDKVAEKLRSLVNVVSHGGNYLLNIGPMDDGAVVPFEEDVLLKIGDWMQRNGDAIYGCSPSPFRNDFGWGAVTVKDDILNLFLSGTCPEDGTIFLPIGRNRPLSISMPEVSYISRNEGLYLKVTEEMYSDPSDIKVISVCLSDEPEVMTSGSDWMDYSYSCFDYYSNYRSTVAYNFSLQRPGANTLLLYHTADEKGRMVQIDSFAGRDTVILEGSLAEVKVAEYEMGPSYYSPLRGGTFNRPSQWNVYGYDELSAFSEGEVFDGRVVPFSNHLMVRNVKVDDPGYIMIEICSGNGAELVLDGMTVFKHLNPYRTGRRTEKVLLYLEEGDHQLLLRAYNRFEDDLMMYIKPSDVSVYCTEVPLGRSSGRGKFNLRISAADRNSVHTDAGLHNITVDAE